MEGSKGSIEGSKGSNEGSKGSIEGSRRSIEGSKDQSRGRKDQSRGQKINRRIETHQSSVKTINRSTPERSVDLPIGSIEASGPHRGAKETGEPPAASSTSRSWKTNPPKGTATSRG